MASKAPRWVVVTGVGCGSIALIVAALGVGGFYFARSALRDFEKADRTWTTVTERYGPIPDFRAEPEGAIPPDRLEAFLAVRDRLAQTRQGAETSLAALSASGERTAGGGVFRRLWSGAGLAHRLAGFHRERNEALLAAGMGLGEYYYIYSLAYYSGLGKPPTDGPSFELVGDSGYVLEKAFQGQSESEVRKRREELARRSLNRLLLPVLRRQHADLASGGGIEGPPGWRESLSTEIAALEADERRLPWEDELPPAIESSLRPYRDRLDGSYSAMLNALEVGLARRSCDTDSEIR